MYPNLKTKEGGGGCFWLYIDSIFFGWPAYRARHSSFTFCCMLPEHEQWASVLSYETRKVWSIVNLIRMFFPRIFYFSAEVWMLFEWPKDPSFHAVSNVHVCKTSKLYRTEKMGTANYTYNLSAMKPLEITFMFKIVRFFSIFKFSLKQVLRKH